MPIPLFRKSMGSGSLRQSAFIQIPPLPTAQALELPNVTEESPGRAAVTPMIDQIPGGSDLFAISTAIGN
jgi:hypothetical protein